MNGLVAFSPALGGRERSIAHGVAGDLGLYHWSEGDGEDRRAYASRDPRPDPGGGRAAAAVAAVARAFLDKPQASWPPLANDLRRVSEGASARWEQRRGDAWETTDERPVHPHADRVAALLAAPPTRASPAAPVARRAAAPRPVNFVDSTEALAALARALEGVDVFGVDLEAHAEHSYESVACLVQISTADADYVVDAGSHPSMFDTTSTEAAPAREAKLEVALVAAGLGAMADDARTHQQRALTQGAI